jgi:rod shape-determining protein MreB
MEISMAQHVYGIDLGTSNFKIFGTANKRLINEKNVIAIKDKRDVFDFGDLAFDMFEKAPSNIEVTFPVRYGVIADIQNMETLFECFFRKVNGNRPVKGSGDFCIAVPTDITEVEKRAFYDLIAESKIKAKHINVVEKPIADAVGLGIEVESPNGNMIINIGADTTEISVISLGGIVLSKLIKTGGTKFDETICNIVRKKYNLIIGRRTAEQIKMHLADAIDGTDDTYNVFGRNIVTGLPSSKLIHASLVYEAIQESLHGIVDAIKIILERTPPELSADIADNGILLSGGGSMLYGMDRLIEQITGIRTRMADDPIAVVAIGTGRYTEFTEAKKGDKEK